MIGSMRLRGKSWEFTVPIGKDEDGNLIREYMTLPPVGGKAVGPRKAKEELGKFVAKVTSAHHVPTAKTTVTELMDYWIKEYAEPNLRMDTITDYKMVKRLYLGGLKNLIAGEVAPAQILRQYNRLAKEVSPHAARKLHRTLRACFSKAVKWGILADNPAKKVDEPSAPFSEQKVITEDHFDKFLEKAAKLPAPKNFICLVALHTGLRAGEIGGLQWSDVKFSAGIISVVRTLKQTCPTPLDDPIFEPVKTKRGARAVVMTNELKKCLTWWQTEQKKQRLQAGEVWRKDLDMVFTNWFGGPVNMKKFSKNEFKDVLENAGLTKQIKFHGLRHSFATFLLSKGVHPKIVQEMMGHANINVTMDTYSHVIPAMQEEAIQKFNQRSATK